MKLNSLVCAIATIGLLVSACSTTGVNPTGMAGGQVMCPSGPRPLIDCRGVLQQYSRDLKADLNLMQKTQIGLGLTTTKLMEADSLTSDLLQHSYQTCTLYNACIVSPQDYAGKTEKLQELQLQVRRTLLGGGAFGQQQNIQINPPFGQPFPPGAPIPGQPFPGQPQPGQPFPGPGPGPQAGVAFPDPNMAQQFPGQPFPQQQPFPGQAFPQQPGSAQFPIGNQPGGPAVTVTAPNSTGSGTADTILNILREGSKLLRSTSPATAAPAPTPTAGVPGNDLDSALRGMLQSLKQGVSTRGLANARAVVGNFTEEGKPYGGPMGALLQDRVSTIVMTDSVFPQATGVQSRGISIKDVQGVKNANDPKALPALYNADVAIAGTYQTRPDGVAVKLTAVQNSGEIASSNALVPASIIPNVVAATPQNANDTNQLINSVSQVAPRAEGQLNITTNRPGQGSNFRMGEEITYFVNSSSDGYLYLFHIDGEKNASRIFPNAYQPNPAIRAGQVIQLPQPGAPFKFEASPPFGLETTFAIVTPVPLGENDLTMIQGSFANANQVGPTLARVRGIAVSPAGGGAPVGGSNAVLWNSATVLIRP